MSFMRIKLVWRRQVEIVFVFFILVYQKGAESALLLRIISFVDTWMVNLLDARVLSALVDCIYRRTLPVSNKDSLFDAQKPLHRLVLAKNSVFLVTDWHFLHGGRICGADTLWMLVFALSFSLQVSKRFVDWVNHKGDYVKKDSLCFFLKQNRVLVFRIITIFLIFLLFQNFLELRSALTGVFFLYNLSILELKLHWLTHASPILGGHTSFIHF